MSEYEITFQIKASKEITIQEIKNWAESVVKDLQEKEKDSDPPVQIQIIYVEQLS